MRKRLLVLQVSVVAAALVTALAGTTGPAGAEPVISNPGPRLALLGASAQISAGSAVLTLAGSTGGAVAVVEPDGDLALDPVSLGTTPVSIGLFGGTATLGSDGPWTGTIDPDAGTVTLNASVSADVTIGPALCSVGPFDLQLSTATPGGQPYYPFAGTATLVARSFTIPPVVADAHCPDVWALLLNAAVPTGPANPSSFTLPVTLLAPAVGPGGAAPTTTTAPPPPTTTTVDPALALLHVADATVTEPDSGSATLDFVVTRAGGLTGPVSATYTTLEAGATHPSDFVKKAGTLSFSSGQTTKVVSVAVKGDLIGEPTEHLELVLLETSGNAVIADDTGVGTIVDNDPPGAVVSDVTIDEPPGTSTTATFTVSLSRPATQSTAVTYRTLDVNAVAPGDYVTKSGTVTIGAGKTQAPIKITVRGDLIGEVDEYFLVELTSITGGNLADSIGVGTIVDDGDDGDAPLPPPGATIDDVEVDETTGETAVVTFTVSLPAPAERSVKVQYATRDMTATAPDDYAAKSGTVSIARGKSSTTIKVNVVGDERVEDVETFVCEIVGVSTGAIADRSGIVTVWDDD